MLTGRTNRLSGIIARHGYEGGQALLFVLIAVTLLASIPLAIATTTIDQLPQTTRNLNYEAAYEAAQAGLNDYMQHLDANEAYGLYSKTNLPTPSNPAFTGWVQAATVPVEYYSYSPTNKSGVIALVVSGKAGTGSTLVVRTFSYEVRPATSLNDVYWSNYETIDPNVSDTESGLPADMAYCATHYGEPSTDSYPGGPTGGVTIPANGPPDDCQVQFYTGDVLNGPIFSNDTFRMCGTPQFLSNVQSGNIFDTNAYPSSIWVTTNGCGSATPTLGPAPQKVSNETPRTSSDDLVPARTYGCFITGGTSPSALTPTNVTITLSVSAGVTTATWTGSGGTFVDNAAGNANTCTSPLHINGVNGLTSGLIFVNGNVTISGQMTGALDVVTCSTSIETSCNGTAPSNITISGNLTYPNGDITMAGGQPTSDSQDALGLIAQNSIEVAEVNNIQIDAAMLALQDSFYVQNWFSGSFGTLNVFGSIAQNFRGPVGTTGPTGYAKNYNYDTSLRSLFPPFFIAPNGATWSPTSYEECGAGLAKSVLNSPSC